MLHKLITRFSSSLRAFRDETRGSVSVEAAIMFPLLMWGFVAMFSYYDAYRQVSVGQKAAFTIADMVSRETDNLDATYINNAVDLFDYLTTASTGSSMRISVIYYDNAAADYYIGWSEARGTVTALTDAIIQAWVDVLPVLPESEALILVETWSGYSAPFNIGLNDTDLENFIFTSPRFASQLGFNS
ncbi:MAG: hypothetical protein Q9M48_04360 [Rhodobacterales bacterium]|nr:hypothetical protein [Rhodobacterales bacterium]